MGEHVAAFHTATNAVQALNRGFDVNCDTRLLYCKRVAGSRVIHVDEEHVRDLWLFPMFQLTLFRTLRSMWGVAVLESVVIRSFTGSKHIDATETKSLSSDGFYFPLAKVQLINSHLMLQENVERDIPVNWDPPSLASFIENFGTHVITSITIGGKDVIFSKQHHSSPLSTLEIKNYIQEIGSQRFSDISNHTSSLQTKSKDKASFTLIPTLYTDLILDVRVIFRRRGGDDLEQDHSMWLRTVCSSPDVIQMTFCPITDLIDEVPGKEHLAHIIGLYLEYKPPIEELRYFLEFQIAHVWAPLHDRTPGHRRKEPLCPSLQFSIMGQNLYVSQEQGNELFFLHFLVRQGGKIGGGEYHCWAFASNRPTSVSRRGSKHNRLIVHLQNLSSLPKILWPYWDTYVAIVENPKRFIGDSFGVYVVTGAQLGVWNFGLQSVLYMKLLFSGLPGCTIKRSFWDHTPNNPDNSSFGSRENNTTGNKMCKYVDLSEMSKGPQDPPGHWLVTSGKSWC
ncbi:hypothetical protein JHK82_026368 [Glycine max]|nr:hypothetical protein JHK82_026368 [Glycine max]